MRKFVSKDKIAKQFILILTGPELKGQECEHDSDYTSENFPAARVASQMTPNRLLRDTSGNQSFKLSDLQSSCLGAQEQTRHSS